jgi:hypothetical protein
VGVSAVSEDVVRAGVCRLFSLSSVVVGEYHLRVDELYDVVRSAMRTVWTAVPPQAARVLMRQHGQTAHVRAVVARERAVASGPLITTARNAAALAGLLELGVSRGGGDGTALATAALPSGVTVMSEEVAMLGGVRHPYVISLFAWDSSGVLVMEEGLIDVFTLVDRCATDPRRGTAGDAGELLHRLYLAATACLGLAHMHACGVVHADLKGNNVVVAVGCGLTSAVHAGMREVLSSRLCAAAGVGRFVAKIIDMSRAMLVPVGDTAVASSSLGGLPGGCVAMRHKAAEKHRRCLAPELWDVEYPYICTATDVYAFARRVAQPLLESPSRECMLRADEGAGRGEPVDDLLAGLQRALARDPRDRPTAKDLAQLFIAAMVEICSRDVA